MIFSKLQISVKNNYGTEAIYPENETAKIFTAITGKKTLNRIEIEHIKTLGFTIETVNTVKI